jgi:hypothetical protein
MRGVIGVQKGPPLAMGFTMVLVQHGGLDWDAGFGDGREDPPGVFRCLGRPGLAGIDTRVSAMT